MNVFWRNCALQADEEIQEIDALEDRLAPLPEEIIRIRELITALELCHHKSERWIYNILEAIREGKTKKRPGQRHANRRHPAEEIWLQAAGFLTRWCETDPFESGNKKISNIPVGQLAGFLGERSDLKEWQVRRVINKIQSVACGDSYDWLLLNSGEYEALYRDRPADVYLADRKFWLQTVKTFIKDTENNKPAVISLALAIDLLWPCHWRFLENLQIVLKAIGGELISETPYSACGRNINLLPNKYQLEIMVNTLQVYGGFSPNNHQIDQQLIQFLGTPSSYKNWLALSLAKTIDMQLHPPKEVREIAAMAGPDWIRL